MTRRRRVMRDPTADQAFPEELLQQVADVLATVSDRERLVLALRFGFEGEAKSYAETAQALGIARGRVVRLESSALSKMRHPSRSFVFRDGLDDKQGKIPEQMRRLIVAAIARRPAGMNDALAQQRAFCSRHGITLGGPLQTACHGCDCFIPAPGDQGGRPRLYCSNQCRQAGYRARRKNFALPAVGQRNRPTPE